MGQAGGTAWTRRRAGRIGGRLRAFPARAAIFGWHEFLGRMAPSCRWSCQSQPTGGGGVSGGGASFGGLPPSRRRSERGRLGSWRLAPIQYFRSIGSGNLGERKRGRERKGECSRVCVLRTVSLCGVYVCVRVELARLAGPPCACTYVCTTYDVVVYVHGRMRVELVCVYIQHVCIPALRPYIQPRMHTYMPSKDQLLYICLCTYMHTCIQAWHIVRMR